MMVYKSADCILSDQESEVKKALKVFFRDPIRYLLQLINRVLSRSKFNFDGLGHIKNQVVFMAI